ncbi:MAG: transcriptional regulator [Bdellovibrionales bacterium RIFCSPHIGHO2_01_FULL_40_29]|nr:MAG: transcriptional regulator [Bdellovibrionales bacterium RIFCSPHIGHO2_01_FULL_40_29]OFZ35481.1 MAG: transcriptional regulator [Bdellovibrionales bacterium RIFCSPHIGHO2_02_FULL_40_15]
MAQFQIELMDGSEQKWEISDYINIGKDNTCGVQIFDPHANDRHARLENRDGVILLKDLRSTSGTFVNGAQILEAILKDGDLISIGQSDFVIHDSKIVKKDFSLTSKCDHWNQQLETLNSVGQSKYPVLLLGPSGTGKDVIAHALHDVSPFSEAPFVSVNCSALTETLVESELFGHIKGSFTGAIADRKGAFESARGGTLFLDEIGDLTYGLQAKLLRALENNEIRPVGSDRSVKTDVRIIAATHQNLYHKIREGSFRSDLFYRLNVITVETPALKERLEDFDELLYSFARQMKVRFSFNAIQALKKHDWPGNIRELRNVVARASALFPKKYIEENHIDILLNKKERLAHLPTGVNYASTTDANQMSVIKEIEKQMILKRLAANNGNQKRTALDLGMPKSTLHDRIRTYSIDLEQFRA